MGPSGTSPSVADAGRTEEVRPWDHHLIIIIFTTNDENNNNTVSSKCFGNGIADEAISSHSFGSKINSNISSPGSSGSHINLALVYANFFINQQPENSKEINNNNIVNY